MTMEIEGSDTGCEISKNTFFSRTHLDDWFYNNKHHGDSKKSKTKQQLIL